MNCPNCNVTLLMSDKQGVEVDYCPQCRGVWLDRGELEKILERMKNDAPTPSPTRETHHQSRQYHHQEPRHYSNSYKKKSKIEVLSDIFDF